MIFRIISSLLFPFFKEAIFGRNVDPDVDRVSKKSIYQKITDFFMRSHRATSSLIIFSLLALFTCVISIKKIASIAIAKEPLCQDSAGAGITAQSVVDVKNPLAIPDNVEDTRREIIHRLKK